MKISVDFNARFRTLVQKTKNIQERNISGEVNGKNCQFFPLTSSEAFPVVDSILENPELQDIPENPNYPIDSGNVLLVTYFETSNILRRKKPSEIYLGYRLSLNESRTYQGFMNDKLHLFLPRCDLRIGRTFDRSFKDLFNDEYLKEVKYLLTFAVRYLMSEEGNKCHQFTLTVPSLTNNSLNF